MGKIRHTVLAKLAAKLGGAEQAAALLGITPSLLQRFLEGSMKVPDSLLLKAVDLVADGVPIEPPPPPQDQSSKGTPAN